MRRTISLTFALASWPTIEPTAPAAPLTTQISPAFGSHRRKPKYAVRLQKNAESHQMCF